MDPAEPPSHLLTLEGALERVTFHSAESGWTVARLAVPGRPDPVTVVGSFSDPHPGENLLLFGQWTTHPVYGPQFKAERYQVVRPATALGIQRYLGSGMIKGIGPKMARRLVAEFGEQTLEVIERDQERLAKVAGIGPRRVETIRRAWAEHREIQNVMVFLHGHGISPAHAVRIYKKYGDRAVERVTENPYRLTEVWGIGFRTADRIAQALGMPADAPHRLQAGLLHVLQSATDAGHVFLPLERLTREAAEVLGVDEPLLPAQCGALASDRRLVVEAIPGTLAGRAAYLPSLHATECGAAARLREMLARPVDRAAGSLAFDLPPSLPPVPAGDAAPTGPALSQEQRDAVDRACRDRLLVLTGGPGTGKTTTTRAIVEALQAGGLRVLLASPTGRAAKRLAELTGQSALTIHRLLEFDPATLGFKRNEEDPLEAGAVILDEASMLDLVLFYCVLKALPPHCRLILVGDMDQLPSVGPGDVLRDLIESGMVPVVRLSRIFRQAGESRIVTNAHRVNRGEMPLLASPREAPGADCVFLEVEAAEAVVSTIVGVVSVSLPKRGFSADEIQVLCPMHRGSAG